MKKIHRQGAKTPRGSALIPPIPFGGETQRAPEGPSGLATEGRSSEAGPWAKGPDGLSVRPEGAFLSWRLGALAVIFSARVTP